MYKLTPTRPNVKDAATGNDMPSTGIEREVLLPPDHYAERSGDITISEIKPPSATTEAALPAPVSEKRETAKAAK